jgi:IS30 family transposase
LRNSLLKIKEAQHQVALANAFQQIPPDLRRSLTWDQGNEMAFHKQFSEVTGTPVYFCNPASPWQRGSNENTNGLLRQYFPKGTDLSHHSAEHLAAVAAELNHRPRKALDWDTPAERLRQLLATAQPVPVVPRITQAIARNVGIG